MEYPFKDLLPLDEVLEREGYYKDWTHLDPEVFYSLTQISEYIKSKGFGVDVRLLIAQLAEHFSLKTTQINETEQFFKDIMLELGKDKEFYSLPEIAGARRGYNTLAESLGNLSVNMINKNLGKLDQTFMTDEFLQQMAGNAPINAVPANNSITRHKLANKSVYPENIKNMYNPLGSNLVNSKDWQVGKKISTVNGNIMEDSSRGLIEKIPVEGGVTYNTKGGTIATVVFYDLNGLFLKVIASNLSVGGGAFTPPESGYVSITASLIGGSTVPNLIVSDSRGSVDNPEHYQLKMDELVVDDTNLPSSVVKGYHIGDKAVSERHLSMVEQSSNLFDKSKVQLDTFLKGTMDEVIPLENYFTSEPIYTATEQKFTLKAYRSYVIFSDKSTLRLYNAQNNDAITTVEVPAGCWLIISGYVTRLDVTQINLGEEVLPYEPSGYRLPDLKLSESQVDDLKRNIIGTPNFNVGVKKSGETFTLSGELGGNEIKIVTLRSGRYNNLFNFSQTIINGNPIHNTTDDITPIRTFTTVGANHGYTTISTVTDPNHDKTQADLGSIWSDGMTEYTLLQINGNDLVFGCPYEVRSNGSIESTRRKPVADLTHVRNGTNTQSVSTSNETGGQLYPSVNKVKVDYILDGELIEVDGEYLGDKLIIKEEYNIMDYKDLIDKAQNNVGIPFDELDIEGVTRMTNTYTFTKGLKNLTSHGIQALKTVNFMRSGFLQSARMGLSGHNLIRYVPNLKPISGFDFGVGEDMDSYDTNLLIQKTDLKDETVPVSYTTDWLVDSNGNKKYGFSMGYITDKTNSKKADRLSNTDVLWDFRSTGKNYPVAIEGITMEAGEYLNFQGFRHYLVPEEVGDAVNISVVKDEVDTYLYTHFEETAIQDVFFNNEIGKRIEVLQTDNLVNLNDTVDSRGVVLNSSGVSSGVFKIK